MARENFSRVNWFDGQEVLETDLDTEQTAWHSSLANNTDIQFGSGVEQEFATQRVLFDTNSVPASIQDLIDAQEFDGAPIYPTDTLGVTVYTQPSDDAEGVYLEVELSGASLDGSYTTRVFIFGTTFGGTFTQEVLTFEQNESQITKTYFTTIVAIMTQDFLGNQNTLVDGVACFNNGGRLRILEALSMSVARDTIMAKQDVEPNMDYVNFKPAVLSKTLDVVLSDIADSASLDADDLDINTTASDTRELPYNDSTGLIVGQKFKATTNNIQKISILLAVKENTLALSGQEFDWSGDIVVGIRPLQTTTMCPTDTIPNSSIEFDPELAPIAEVSFDQDDLASLGITLTDSPQIVDFVFTQSLISNPNLEPTIEVGKYYIVTIRRFGDISVGTIVLQEAANTNSSPDETDEMYMSIFAQNTWTDVPESDLWFKIHTDAVRVTNGTAFDDGIQITIPRTTTNSATGLSESYVEGNHSMIDVSRNSKNYVLVQKSIEYTDSVSHPTTGNRVFSRIKDAPDIVVVSEDTLTDLIDSGSEPVVLGSVNDTNPVDNPEITGTTLFPGLVTDDTFTIIQPSSDIRLNNLVGSILVPNINESTLQYRIIKVEVFDDAYGDINNDGEINSSDVARAQALDGYGKDLQSGSLSSTIQRNAIIAGTVTMEEIIRADVNNDGFIDVVDPQIIQQHIALGTGFAAGSNFGRAVLTVENITNPLTTSPDMVSADSSFNDVPFSSIEYRIDFVPLWSPYNLELNDLRRFIPKTFTRFESTDITSTPYNGGKNTIFIPGDILLGGDILNTDETNYKIDLEVNTIIVELPAGGTQGEVDIFSNFIKDQMYFYDGTVVSSSALSNNQVRVTTSIQSFVKDVDGYDYLSVDGTTQVDESIAVLYTQSSGILRIRTDNIRNIIGRPELRTKIVLSVFLKKAGFRNTEVTVSADEFNELLTLL